MRAAHSDPAAPGPPAGRTYVTPDDVSILRHSVLRHRLVLTYDALADGVAPETIIDAVFSAVPTP